MFLRHNPSISRDRSANALARRQAHGALLLLRPQAELKGTTKSLASREITMQHGQDVRRLLGRPRPVSALEGADFLHLVVNKIPGRADPVVCELAFVARNAVLLGCHL